MRGDGTCTYFFTEEEVLGLFERAGFKCRSLVTHERLMENRAQGLTMHRKWVQVKAGHRRGRNVSALWPLERHAEAARARSGRVSAVFAAQAVAVAEWTASVTQGIFSLDPNTERQDYVGTFTPTDTGATA